jgi:uncharacterized protein YkwD
MRIITATMLYALFSSSLLAQSLCPPSQTKGIHIVQKEETLYGISKAYKITVAQLRQWNGMGEKDVLQECTQLSVPMLNVAADVPKSYNMVVTSKAVVPVMDENRSETEGTPNFAYFRKSLYLPFYHIVSYYETLESISKIYGLTVGDVVMMNNLSGKAALAEGQKLILENRNQTRNGNYAFDEVFNTARQPSAQQDMPKSYNQPMGVKSESVVEEEKPEVRAKAVPKQEPKKDVKKAISPVATSMNAEELDMVKEINLVRGNPSGYIPYIQEYIDHLKKTGDMGNSIETAQELIAELKKTKILSTLQPLQCVYTAAKKHGEDQKRRGETDHQGSDGSYPWDRVKRECPDLQDGNENLVGGPANIRRAVILLLVDAGIEGRGHRKTMLNPDWQYVACYKMGTVGSMPNCWVQKFAF